jgi:hypothetical protein
MISNEPSANAVRLPFMLLIGLLLAAALSGGSNRGDILAVMLVRLAAVLCLGVAIARLPRGQLRDITLPLSLLAALAIWIVLQCVPLPPAIWTVLPGRKRLAETALAIGIAQPWMSISIVPLRTLNSLLSLLAPAAALVLVAWLPRATWGIQMRILVGVGLVSGILAIIQLSGPIDSHWYLYDVRQKGGAVGLFANRNHQAALLAIMFPMLAVIGLRAARASKGGLAVLLSSVAIGVFLLPLIFITGSRGGLLLSAASLVATAALVLPRLLTLRIPRWWFAAGAAGLVVMAAGLAVILLSDRSLAMQRLTATDVGEEQRVLVIAPVLQLITDNLPVGTGFGTFDPAFRAAEPYSQLYRTYLNHAHSDPLEFLSDGGVPAGLILLVFLLWWGRTSLVIWMRSKAGDVARMASIGTALLMLASLVDYPLRTPLAATVFAILVGWMAKAAYGADMVDGDMIDFRKPKTERKGDRMRRRHG